MDFLLGVVFGMIAGPFMWELGKWGYRKLLGL